MRMTVAIICAAALAACGPRTLQQTGTGSLGANRLADALAGRAAGTPRTCLPAGPMWTSESLRDGTIAFRRGNQFYLSTFQGGCSQLGRPGYALVTTVRGPGMCSGDIARIMDTSTGMVVGHCVLGPFVPYRPMGRLN